MKTKIEKRSSAVENSRKLLLYTADIFVFWRQPRSADGNGRVFWVIGLVCQTVARSHEGNHHVSVLYLYLCICVCICIYICICMYIHIYTYLSFVTQSPDLTKDMTAYAYIHMYVYVYLKFIYIYMHICTCIYIYKYIHMYVYTYIQMSAILVPACLSPLEIHVYSTYHTVTERAWFVYVYVFVHLERERECVFELSGSFS